MWLNTCILDDSGSCQADNLTLTIKDTYCSFHNSSFPLFSIAIFDDDDEQRCYCTWCVHKTYFWSVQRSAHVIQKKQTITDSIGQDMRQRKSTFYSYPLWKPINIFFFYSKILCQLWKPLVKQNVTDRLLQTGMPMTLGTQLLGFESKEGRNRILHHTYQSCAMGLTSN